MRRTRYRGVAEVTRALRGPLQVARSRRYRAGPLHHPSRTLDVPVRRPSGGSSRTTSPAGSRWSTTRATTSTTPIRGCCSRRARRWERRRNGYTRQYAILRGYLQVREGTVLPRAIGGRRGWEARPRSTRASPFRAGRTRFRCSAGNTPTERSTPDGCRQGVAVRQPRGTARPAAVRRSRRGHADGLRGCGTGVRAGEFQADHRRT